MNFKIVSETDTSPITKKVPVNDVMAPDGFTTLDYTALKNAAAVLRAVNNKPRKKLIGQPTESGRLNVSDIHRKLLWEQSVVSINLAVLRQAKIVLAEREGRTIYNSLDHDRLSAISKAIQGFI